MGQITLVCRLAMRDLRRRPAQAVLLLVVLTTALATATLALALHGVTSQPYAQTRAATAGPDVTASSAGLSPNQLQSFSSLAHASGVTAASGPFPAAWPVLRARGLTAYAMAEGRDEAPAAVDQPDVVQGSWVRPGGVVVERAFADALGVRVGDDLTLDGQSFRVTGIAVTAAVPVFSQVCFYAQCSGPGGKPRSPDTGLIWLTRTAAQGLTRPGNLVTSYLNLRLTDPAQASAFVAAHQMTSRTGSSALTAWPSLNDAAATLVAQEQNKRVGLLKAAGGTPPLAATVLLAEHLAVALAAAAAGLAAGWLAAPCSPARAPPWSAAPARPRSPGPPSPSWSPPRSSSRPPPRWSRPCGRRGSARSPRWPRRSGRHGGRCR
jgi:putative ABC transport system permease protein